MNKFEITIILKNGIVDVTETKFQYKNANDLYIHLNDIREYSEYLKFTIDDYIVEYRFDDITCIKIKPIKNDEE